MGVVSQGVNETRGLKAAKTANFFVIIITIIVVVFIRPIVFG